MHIPHIRNIAVPLRAPCTKTALVSIIKIAVILLCSKDFTDPHNLLIGITIIVSVVEGIQMRIHRGDFAITIYGFPMEAGFAGSHDCGNFSGSDGNIEC
jgi:hypothetical protein